MPSKKRLAEIDTNDDPLAHFTAPPPNESPVEREARLKREAEEKLVSDAIDEEINRQKSAEKKAPKPVKLLLLGKSTTLKNFQLMNSADAFRKERASWRAVIQLNVVRSIRMIFDAMTEAQTIASNPPSPASSSSLPRHPLSPVPTLTPEHLKLKMRLSPLFQIEEVLINKLSPQTSTHLSTMTNMPYTERAKQQLKELSVNSANPWKNTFNKLIPGASRSSFESAKQVDWNDPNDPGVVLHACSEDMQRLWTDPTIRAVLDNQKLRMEELAGFFLDSLERVTAPRYIPTDEDIMRARLKTVGVSENKFTLKASASVGRDWRVYDVGGQRSLVSAWVPYFDDMDAIIFLAPISCFDQVLEEDPGMAILLHSVLLWKAIVSNPLLKSTNLMLFLNKCDILDAKLRSGIKLADYVTSYGERPNVFEEASQYLRRKFAAILRDHSPVPRQFYSHFTSVTDIKATMTILQNVQEIVLRENLSKSALM
ncbi:G-alpha-domain-containing protein [Pterulicium gracile]|uniref:G-alpha-domain-containing protein n=1 Tax=Pterulicium gracile TaxID=1884261 RepID=A0A5C3QBW3_9AGAR|nr:G-alpha-domain-containing protein [Pterula gracilis]